jgi:hypothetical protein
MVNMIIVGLLMSQQEVVEIQYISRICMVKQRIHDLVQQQKMIEKELADGTLS